MINILNMYFYYNINYSIIQVGGENTKTIIVNREEINDDSELDDESDDEESGDTDEGDSDNEDDDNSDDEESDDSDDVDDDSGDEDYEIDVNAISQLVALDSYCRKSDYYRNKKG